MKSENINLNKTTSNNSLQTIPWNNKIILK